ncbi:MAG: response regulator [Planctomycetes bacterium]|nr:response regulator [Planctomycetota bacterium]
MDKLQKVILYVDDDRDFRDAVRVIIEAGGYRMVEADSAEQGLQVFKAERPDLVLVDLMMEEVDAGTRLVRKIQALGSKVPIYMLSSTGDGFVAAADYGALGLAGVFQKPIEPKVLLTALRAKLG